MKTITIGTRGSQLALWQAYFTQAKLEEVGYTVEIKIIVTQGDKIGKQWQKTPTMNVREKEGKGFFTKEIERELLTGRIDLAVHSFKDLPTEMPQGLVIAANSYRENPADSIIIHKNAVDIRQQFHLKKGAIVGTSSARRKGQLKAFRPDLVTIDVRGNVPTRVSKIDTPHYDAVVLAAAGLQRLELDLSAYHVFELPIHLMIPAPAQGVLAYQIREKDAFMHKVVAHLHDAKVQQCIDIERTTLNRLEGGCRSPLGIYCQQTEGGVFQAWISHANELEDFPKRVFIEQKTPKNLIEKLVKSVQNEPKSDTLKTILITRKLARNSFFRQAVAAKSLKVYARSLIQFSPVDFGELPATDWVFFSSKNGVKYFFEQGGEIARNTKIAAIGQGTATILKQYEKTIDFIGKGADIQMIAKQFVQQAKGEKVLFLQASQSKKSIQRVLGKTIVSKDVVVYENTPISTKKLNLPNCDILVFTSPLNVEAYCQKYKITKTQKVIAIGKTTAKQLDKKGCTHYQIAFDHSEASLADLC